MKFKEPPYLISFYDLKNRTAQHHPSQGKNKIHSFNKLA